MQRLGRLVVYFAFCGLLQREICNQPCFLEVGFSIELVYGALAHVRLSPPVVAFHDNAKLTTQISPTTHDLNLNASWVAGRPDRVL
jgi:hypothetical protein